MYYTKEVTANVSTRYTAPSSKYSKPNGIERTYILNIPSCEEEYLDHLNGKKYWHFNETATPTATTTTFWYKAKDLGLGYSNGISEYYSIRVTFKATEEPQEGELEVFTPHLKKNCHTDPKAVGILVNL